MLQKINVTPLPITLLVCIIPPHQCEIHVPLELHPEGKLLIQERIRETAGQDADVDAPENRQRLKMAEFPQGASLIPNPYNRIPGFTIGQHHFVPGFPVMAWPMIARVLDTHYPHLAHRQARAERALLAYEAAEATLTPLMEQLEARYPGVRVFSLPSVGDENTRRHIELGVKGEPGQVAAAFSDMLAELDRLGAEYRTL